MKVMVVGGGAREQAIGLKLATEGHSIVMSPGNPGNEGFADSTHIRPTDIDGQLGRAKRDSVELTIVGADDPLAMGIVDAFSEEKLTAFGPTRAEARIEWDKNFAKELGRRNSIPMGPYATFIEGEAALEYAQDRSWPLFVKDNGLAQGKGALRCNDIREFEEAIRRLKGKSFVVEDYVGGPEASHHAFCDGKTQLSMPFLVRDHKHLGDNDSGPMTGGMGVVGPLPNYMAAEVRSLGETFVSPVVQELGFKGVLFSGLKGPKGFEQNLEWNARLGDPETQVFMRLMESELLPVIMACVEGKLDQVQAPQWELGKFALSLVLAAEGYPDPDQLKKGLAIEGLDDAAKVKGVQVLHAATRRQGNQLVTDGGRVLNVVSLADTLEQAIDRAYQAADKIGFSERPPLMRSDIGRSVVVAEP